MDKIRNHFYRVSIKALLLNTSRDKFVITKKESGQWELPGGGLKWGASPQEDLKREIQEEMGLSVTWIADNPSYFLTRQKTNEELWIANVVYEAELESLNFIPSEECIEMIFVNMDDVSKMDDHYTGGIKQIANLFKPTKFIR